MNLRKERRYFLLQFLNRLKCRNYSCFKATIYSWLYSIFLFKKKFQSKICTEHTTNPSHQLQSPTLTYLHHFFHSFLKKLINLVIESVNLIYIYMLILLMENFCMHFFSKIFFIHFFGMFYLFIINTHRYYLLNFSLTLRLYCTIHEMAIHLYVRS